MANELATYPASLSGAYGKLRVLSVLSNGGALNGLNQMAALVSGNLAVSGIVREADLESTRAYSFLGSDAVYTFCDGISTQEQGQGIVDGYLGPRSGPVTPGTNAWFERASELIFNNITAVGGEGRRFYLAGYSAGGAIVQYLATRLFAAYPLASVYVTAIGAPAAYGTYFPDSLSPGGVDYRSASWFNSDDPVPCIPPKPNFWTLFWRNNTWPQRNNLSAFNPIPNAREVNLGNGVAAATLPTQVVPPVTEAIATWLRAQVRGIGNSHSIETYLGRFSAASALLADPNVPPANAQPLPPQVPIGPRLHNAQANALVDLVVHDARRQNAVALVIPKEQLFRVFKQGQLWAVYFGDVQVYLSASKRNARIFKNSANRFLQRFQKGPVVDPGQLISQLTQYLAIASLPDGPIQPPLNIAP